MCSGSGLARLIDQSVHATLYKHLLLDLMSQPALEVKLIATVKGTKTCSVASQHTHQRGIVSRASPSYAERAREGLGTRAHPACIGPGISGHQSDRRALGPPL